MTEKEIVIKVLVWLLVAICIGYARLGGIRKVPTAFSYAAVVLSALMLGRYLGIAETIVHPLVR